MILLKKTSFNIQEILPSVFSCLFQICLQGPTLLINVNDCNGELRQLANQFTVQLSEGGLSEMSEIAARIVKATTSGKLTAHPCIVGIILQCIDMLNREERGIDTLKKRRKMSDTELDLVHSAGLLLSSNGCSADLMRKLGFNKESCNREDGGVDRLLSQGLPCPSLSLLQPTTIAQNVALIDGLLERHDKLQVKQRCVLCFDCTYLLPLHAPMTLGGQKGLVGSPFKMEDVGSDNPGVFQSLSSTDKKLSIAETTKANRMLLGFRLDIEFVNMVEGVGIEWN